jgi:hypothetical protein
MIDANLTVLIAFSAKKDITRRVNVEKSRLRSLRGAERKRLLTVIILACSRIRA